MIESWFSSAYSQEPLTCSGVSPDHCRLLFASTMRSAMNGLPLNSTGSVNVTRSLAELMADTLLIWQGLSTGETDT